MIGQKDLLDELHRIDKYSFPHTCLITGELGSGKHLFAAEIAKHLNNIEIVDVFGILTDENNITQLKSIAKRHGLDLDELKKIFYPSKKVDALRKYITDHDPNANKGMNADKLQKEMNSLNKFDPEDVREYVQQTIYTEAFERLYLFDMSLLRNNRSDTLQYTMLRLAEEPPTRAFLVIIAENKNILLNTIINRCRIFEMQPYSKAELMNFTKDELVATILRTPGQIILTSPEAIKKCSDVAETIAEKITTINLPNLLKVVDMINYKDNYDKIDFNLFFDVLANKLFIMYKEENKLELLTYYLFVINERKKLRSDQQVLTLERERFMEHFLVSFWEVAHGL